MLFQLPEILQVLADIVGAILNVLGPIVSPIGEFMVLWIEYVLAFFPDDNWTIYIVIFAILFIAGIIVNTRWPGDQPSESEEKEEAEDLSESLILDEEESDIQIDEDKEKNKED